MSYFFFLAGRKPRSCFIEKLSSTIKELEQVPASLSFFLVFSYLTFLTLYCIMTWSCSIFHYRNRRINFPSFLLLMAWFSVCLLALQSSGCTHSSWESGTKNTVKLLNIMKSSCGCTSNSVSELCNLEGFSKQPYNQRLLRTWWCLCLWSIASLPRCFLWCTSVLLREFAGDAGGHGCSWALGPIQHCPPVSLVASLHGQDKHFCYCIYSSSFIFYEKVS